jgi:hypothetical protein
MGRVEGAAVLEVVRERTVRQSPAYEETRGNEGQSPPSN